MIAAGQLIAKSPVLQRSLYSRSGMQPKITSSNAISPPRIYVVCQACDDGYGDYVFACRMGNAMKKVASKCQVILCGIDDSTHQTLSRFVENRKLYCTLAEKSIDFRRMRPETLENTLIIHGPVLKKQFLLPFDFPQQNIWHIGEYSNCAPVHENISKPQSSGLGDDEWGIFNIENKSDRNLRMKSFRNSILAENIPNLSQDPVYLAYCYDYRTILSFIQVIINAHKDNEETIITLCLPGDRKKIGFQELLRSIPRILSEEVNAPSCCEFVWKSNNIVAVDTSRSLSPPPIQISKKRKDLNAYCHYFESDQQSLLQWQFSSKKSSCTLRVLFPGFLSQEDMQKLRAHSNCSCITGDQSFSDHLGKVILYERRPHKDKFFTYAIELAQKHNLQHLARFWERTQPIINPNSDCGGSLASTLESIPSIYDPLLQQQSRKFGQIIQENHNLVKKVAKEFQKWKRSKTF